MAASTVLIFGILVLSFAAGNKDVDRLHKPMLLFDAAGLPLFAVVGAQKALLFGLGPVMAALLGMSTGIGGGMARDVLLNEIPQVLRSGLHAVAALGGAAIVVAGHVLGAPCAVSATAGAIVCFVVRFMAMKYGWRLPTGPFRARARAETALSDGDNA